MLDDDKFPSFSCECTVCAECRGEQTRSSANTEPQQLLDSGPMLLRDFNPKGILRFSGRKCVTCQNEIMDHWLRKDMDKSLLGLYWCTRDGNQWSEGIDQTVWDVPEGFGQDVNITKQSGDK